MTDDELQNIDPEDISDVLVKVEKHLILTFGASTQCEDSSIQF